MIPNLFVFLSLPRRLGVQGSNFSVVDESHPKMSLGEVWCEVGGKTLPIGLFFKLFMEGSDFM